MYKINDLISAMFIAQYFFYLIIILRIYENLCKVRSYCTCYFDDFANDQ